MKEARITEEQISKLKDAIKFVDAYFKSRIAFKNMLDMTYMTEVLNILNSLEVVDKVETPKVEGIKVMVNRFLGWSLPEDFNPDCGISFDNRPEGYSWPTGTNLLNAGQAKAMFEYCCEALDGEDNRTEAIERSWNKFNKAISNGPTSPFPEMASRFEAHYGREWTDKDWRSETCVWAAAWKEAIAYQKRAGGLS